MVVLRRWLIVLVSLVPLMAVAQEETSLEAWVEETGDNWSAGEMSDQWQQLLAHPVNLNDSASVADLYLLSPFQRQALHNYILLHGQLLSHKELLFVPGFDSAVVALLLLVTVTEPYVPPRRWNLADGHHQFLFSIGGKSAEETEGDNLHALLYYSYNLYNKMEIRLVADKDAGEVWGRGNFYGYHLMFNDIGRLERLIVGRYNLQFGQGLTLWTGLRPFNLLGFSPLRYGAGVRPATAFYEEAYQEGLAARVRLAREWRLSAFGSYVDATALTGGHLQWRRGGLIVGLTMTATFLDSVATPRAYLYNEHVFRGQDQFNMGIDAVWQWRRLTLFGETAVGENGAPAAIGGLMMRPDGYHRLGITARCFHPDYHNLYAQPYVLGAMQGERGVSLDAESRLPLGLTALVSLDVYGSTALRYADYSPSTGEWLRLQLSRQWGTWITATVRYACRRKERNIPNLDSTLYLGENTLRQQWQGEVRATLGHWRLTARGVFSAFDSENGSPQQGNLASLAARYEWQRLQASAALAWFDVDGYYARIYYNESNLQYAWSMPALNGRGWRGHAVVRYRVSERLLLAAKYTLTYTSDAATNGSGIAQTWMLQLRWRF